MPRGYFASCTTEAPTAGLFAFLSAALADEEHDAGARDELLRKQAALPLLDNPKSSEAVALGDAHQQLARLFKEALAKKSDLKRTAVDAAVANVTADNRADFYFFAGRFLELRGKKEAAAPYFHLPRHRYAGRRPRERQPVDRYHFGGPALMV